MNKLQTAVDKREVDRYLAVHAFTGALICSLLSRVKKWFDYEQELMLKIERRFGTRMIRGEFQPYMVSDHDILTRYTQT